MEQISITIARLQKSIYFNEHNREQITLNIEETMSVKQC